MDRTAIRRVFALGSALAVAFHCRSALADLCTEVTCTADPIDIVGVREGDPLPPAPDAPTPSTANGQKSNAGDGNGGKNDTKARCTSDAEDHYDQCQIVTNQAIGKCLTSLADLEFSYCQKKTGTVSYRDASTFEVAKAYTELGGCNRSEDVEVDGRWVKRPETTEQCHNELAAQVQADRVASCRQQIEGEWSVSKLTTSVGAAEKGPNGSVSVDVQIPQQAAQCYQIATQDMVGCLNTYKAERAKCDGRPAPPTQSDPNMHNQMLHFASNGPNAFPPAGLPKRNAAHYTDPPTRGDGLVSPGANAYVTAKDFVKAFKKDARLTPAQVSRFDAILKDYVGSELMRTKKGNPGIFPAEAKASVPDRKKSVENALAAIRDILTFDQYVVFSRDIGIYLPYFAMGAL